MSCDDLIDLPRRREDPIDFTATDAGVAFLAVVDAGFPEDLREFVCESVSRALQNARAVPTTKEGMFELRRRWELVRVQRSKIREVEEHLTAAAGLLGMEDENLLQQLVVAGLRTVSVENTRTVQMLREAGLDHWLEISPDELLLGTSAGYEASRNDVDRARILDEDDSVASEFYKSYGSIFAMVSADRSRRGGKRQPSPAAMVTRMVWYSFSRALRERTETWSPTVGIARLLGTYTPHDLTPKRVRRVLDDEQNEDEHRDELARFVSRGRRCG